jgi:hypothetical protein
MRKNCLKVFVWGICLAMILGGCHSTGGYGRPTDSLNTQTALLRAASERLGVPVRTERMVTVSQGGATLLTAPAANLEAVPATELPQGVDVAVAYLDSPRQPFPAGFYTLRGFADAREPGTVEGRMDVVDANRQVVGQLPARFEIFSMTLPDRPERLVTNVSFHSSRLAGHCNPATETCYCCTNGWIVCTSRIWQPFVNQTAVAVP